MFGRKSKRTQKREAHQKALREGLIFWLPGGSSQINVYLDYCVIRCLGKTKMKEKEREIPFTSIRDVIYTPATVSRMARQFRVSSRSGMAHAAGSCGIRLRKAVTAQLERPTASIRSRTSASS